MNIEELNKTQLLVLTILVNFVTAIATAVLTVSLLDEAPPTVTQTVNRIVERTVETAGAVPVPGIVTKETTVVIKDEDLLAAAIAADVARTVGIHKGASTTPSIALGSFLPKARAVVTATTAGLPREVVITFPNGAAVPASISRANGLLTIYGFSDTATLPTVAAPDLIASANLKQGQTLVALTSGGSAQTGIISKVDSDGVHAEVSSIPLGAAAVNISGDLIGISTGVPGLFAPTEKITALLSASSTPTH